jgi:hypothetical protein
MPDYNGVLTQPDRQVIDVWLKKNWNMGSCPVCRKQNWALADHVVNPVLYNGIGFSQNSGYPQIMVICNVCGYIMYFNAVTVGIIQGVAHG